MKIINKKIVWEGKFIRITKKDFVTDKGENGEWEIVEHTRNYGKSPMIFALTPEKEVILEKIYRVPSEAYIIELPAGFMDKEDERPEDAARRELLEETGYLADKMIPVLEGPFATASTAEEITIFFAPDVKFTGKHEREFDEEIEVLKVPVDKLVDFILNLPKDIKVELEVLSAVPILKKKGFI